MARIKDKEKVINLRIGGMSYSQIKEETGISKSTLSNWLSDYPLSVERIKALRDNNPRRIEKYRLTMKKKREDRLDRVYKTVSKDLGSFSKRDIFIGGLFLYWGEGLKTERYTTSLANTNPNVVSFYLGWLTEMFNVEKKHLRVVLHLYEDMDIYKEISFWSKKLKLPKSCFGNPYIKKTKLCDITYKNGFNHGTCNLTYHNRDVAEYIKMGLRYIENMRP